MNREMDWTQKQSEVRTSSASALLDADMQDVRQFLREVRHSYLYTQVLCERAERYRSMAMRATSRVDALRVSGTPNRSKVETYVLEMVDVHDELKRETDKLLEKSRKAEKLIRLLPDHRHRMVLQLRYLCGMKWEEVAKEMVISLRWVHRLHGAALKELEYMRERMKRMNKHVEKEAIAVREST